MMCRYVFCIVVILACPSLRATLAINTPANNSNDAWVWRSPCMEISEIPQFLQCLVRTSFTVELYILEFPTKIGLSSGSPFFATSRINQSQFVFSVRSRSAISVCSSNWFRYFIFFAPGGFPLMIAFLVGSLWTTPPYRGRGFLRQPPRLLSLLFGSFPTMSASVSVWRVPHLLYIFFT